MKKVITIQKQNIIDISIQEMGTIEGVFELALTNGVSLTDLLDGGMVLHSLEPIKIDVTNYFKNSNYHIVSYESSQIAQYIFSQTLPFIL